MPKTSILQLLLLKKKQTIFNSLDDDLDNSEYNLDDLEQLRNDENFSENFLEENLEKQQLKIIFEKIFARNDIITAREMEVLLLLYGIDDDKEKTLSEVGKILGIWTSAVQKACNSAFAKIRRSEYAVWFSEMLEKPELADNFYRSQIWNFQKVLRSHYIKMPSKSKLRIDLETIYDEIEAINLYYMSIEELKEIFHTLEWKKSEIIQKLSRYYGKELRDL